jgi:hypothetical protein
LISAAFNLNRRLKGETSRGSAMRFPLSAA